jgi:hypothetical protein
MSTPIDFDAELANLTTEPIPFRLKGQDFRAEGMVTLGSRRALMQGMGDDSLDAGVRFERVIDMACGMVVEEDRARFKDVLLTQMDERMLAVVVQKLMEAYEGRPTQSANGSSPTSGRTTGTSTVGAPPGP